MHGSGRLQLPNGDEYVGDLENGHKHGQGAYLDAKGDVYQGGFLADAHDGMVAITRTDGSSYLAVFHADVEIPDNRDEITKYITMKQQALFHYPGC